MISDLGSGGSERQLVELLLNLDLKLVNPFLVYYRPDTFYLKELEKSGVKIFYLPKRRRDKFFFWRVVRFIKEINLIVKTNKIDLIHAFGPSANFWARITGRLSRRKTIISIRCTIMETQNNWVQKFLGRFNLTSWYLVEKIFSKYADTIIVNTKAIKNIYLSRIAYPADKISVINNGFNFNKVQRYSNCNVVELRKNYNFATGKFIILNVGRITEQKNQLCLLKAAKILLNQGINNFEIIFVGKRYEYADQLDEYIKINKLVNLIKFFGERNDVYAIIKSADCLVLSSLYEGFSNVVLEAMAVGTLTISSQLADIDKLISNGRTGFLFANNNYEQLADKISLAMKLSAGARAEIIERARQHVKNNFLIENTVKETMAVYNNLSAK